MIVPFEEPEFADLVSLWNRLAPPRYKITSDTLARATVNCPLFWPEGSGVVVDSSGDPVAMLVLKESASPKLFAGQNPSLAHVSLLVTSGLSRELLERARDAALERGVNSLVFGMDVDHLFPGCPEGAQGVRSALLEFGFTEKGRCCDLERDLSDFVLPSRCFDVTRANSAIIARGTEAQIDELDAFIAREFSPRWRFEVMRKCRLDKEPNDVFILTVEGRIEGFAMTQHEGVVRPVNGATWKQSLGPDWGALGPIGVSQAVRGKGLGHSLLCFALEGLHRAGARQTIIDWTTLQGFYGSVGFVPTRWYTGMELSL